MHRLAAVIVKEFHQISRDKRTLLLLIVFPAFLLLLFGYAVDFDVKNVKTAVLDYDNSDSSRRLITMLRLYDHFDIRYHLTSYNQIDGYLNRGDAALCIVIPEDFSDKLISGENANIQVLLDGTNSNTGMTALGNLNMYIQDFSKKILIEAFKKTGIKKEALPVDIIHRIWYNPELKSAKFLVPGLIGFILMMVCVIATSLSIVREKERFTIEQISVSPIKAQELIIGKTLPYMLISLLTSFFILIVGMILFDITIKGSIFYLFISVLIFVFSALGIGMLISTITESQQVAFMIALLSTMLPSMILSGFVFPISSMPKVIQFVTYLVPLRYFLVILRSIILKGSGFLSFWEPFLLLTAFSVFMIMISSLRLKKSL
ncbi:ABC transporter permease [candidate division KSB1 bacterium]